MKIVLASQSPRRRQLLGQMGLEFTTQSPEIDEAAFQGRDARDLVQILSREKARWIAGQVDPETLVIGADTVVVRDGEILGKPKGEEEARAMLASLSGRTHQVCTGVTVCRGDKVLTQVEETQVTFRPLTDQEIRQYVSTGEPMDKAGAYGIQGLPQCGGPAGLPLGADAPGLRRGLSGTGWPLTWGVDSGVPARPGTGEDLP